MHVSIARELLPYCKGLLDPGIINQDLEWNPTR